MIIMEDVSHWTEQQDFKQEQTRRRKKTKTKKNITKTRLFEYKENFTSKNRNFSEKKNLIFFFIFLLKT